MELDGRATSIKKKSQSGAVTNVLLKKKKVWKGVMDYRAFSWHVNGELMKLLLAVVKATKSKVRSVLDFWKLNNYVMSYWDWHSRSMGKEIGGKWLGEQKLWTSSGPICNYTLQINYGGTICWNKSVKCTV